MTLPPIYVISLEREKARRENMQRRLNTIGANYEIVNAVDGKAINPSQYANRLRRDLWRKNMQKEPTLGEIGCYLSHYQLWQKIASGENECALVLEDDALWGDDFADIVMGVVNCEWQWEVVNIGHQRKRKHDFALCEIGSRKLVRHCNYPGIMAAAYLIRPTGASKLLKHCRIMKEPIDFAYVRYWQHGAAFYHIDPPPVWQDDTPSAVQTDKTISQTITAHLARALNRKYERWHRRIYRWTHRPQKK